MAKFVATPDMLPDIILKTEEIRKGYISGYKQLESLYDMLSFNSNSEDFVLNEFKKQLVDFSPHMNSFCDYLLNLIDHMNKVLNMITTLEEDKNIRELFN